MNDASPLLAVSTRAPSISSTEAHAHGVTHTRLGNGLEVVMIRDHRAPVATHMVWYKNGAADDPVGKSGIAHFLEHLMFKGTRKYPAGTINALIADLGGEQNAFTSKDFTAYFQRIPAEHLAICMEYEADRMTGLVLADDAVESERQVVLEERLMRIDSHPAQVLGEALQIAVYTTHPYGKPVIGWQHEIRGLGRRDALDYYERFYTPENAVLVVAGDVEPTATIDLAERFYGTIKPRGAAPVRNRPSEPKPTTHRQVSLADPRVAQPQFQRLHLVPSYGNAEPGEAEAFDVLALLLGRGQTGVLYRRLVLRDGIASGVGASYHGTALQDGSFGLQAVPRPGVSLDQLDAAIEAVIRDCSLSGFDRVDIQRAKNRLVANALYARDSQMSLSQLYGCALCIGMTVETVQSWPERIAAVSSEDLLRALRRLDRATGVSGLLLRAVGERAPSIAA
jgi:zinc protease